MEVYQNLKKHLSTPDLIEKTRTGKMNSVTWKNVNGLDGIIYTFTKKYKWHPYPAPVYIYAYKYLNVPEMLIGPLKYASETIKIDEIDVPQKYSKLYHKTGRKMRAKVTGSCASVVISAITIKFVEDMIKKYRKVGPHDAEFKKLYKIFRNEYDNRIKHYIETKTIVPKISWLKNDKI
jgi:hypothetical protein